MILIKLYYPIFPAYVSNIKLNCKYLKFALQRVWKMFIIDDTRSTDATLTTHVIQYLFSHYSAVDSVHMLAKQISPSLIKCKIVTSNININLLLGATIKARSSSSWERETDESIFHN